MKNDEWIIDGNYMRTLPLRLAECDTVIYFDLPTPICMEGARSRIGRKREDIPWIEEKLDPELITRIKDFPNVEAPKIAEHLKNTNKTVIQFHTREASEEFLESIP